MVNDKKVTMIRGRSAHKRYTGFDVFNGILMFFIMLITLYPFWYTVVTSFSKVSAGGLVFWPKQFDLTAYKLLFQYDLMWSSYRNTIARTVLGTALSVFFTAVTAYPLSKRDLPFNSAITNFILFTMLFSGGLIPTYIWIKQLNMINTLWALVIPNMMGAYNIFIVRNFFRSIPSTVEESARIDGANWLLIWVKIVLPLSMPVIATVTLWTLVSHWNSWFDALIYITDNTKTVVQVILRKIAIENNSTDINNVMAKMTANSTRPTGKTLESAMIVVTMVPMLVVYPFLQKYFVKGVMIGSIKG